MTDDRAAPPAAGTDHDEDALTAVLRARADDLPPPARDLVDAAVIRGRRLRRRRRAAGTAAVVTLVAAGIAVPFAVVRGAGSAHTAATAVVPSPPGPASSAPAAAVRPVTAGEMLALLRGLLPAGLILADAEAAGSSGAAPEGVSAAGVVLDGSGGRTGLTVRAYRRGPGTPEGACPPVQVHPYDRCTVTTSPDGSALTVNRSRTDPNSPSGQQAWTVQLQRPDGGMVIAEALGGGTEKSTTSEVAPLLTMDQLTSMVTSPAWGPVLAALPVPEASFPRPEAALWPRERMERTLTPLLPPGLAPSRWWGGAGLVSVVVDDGRGPATVDVQVQMWERARVAEIGCRVVRVPCTESVAPDGARVLRYQRPSDKGGEATVRVVEVLRPDGLRVVARATDAVAEAAPVTRAEPPLTLDQLQAIAADRAWVLP